MSRGRPHRLCRPGLLALALAALPVLDGCAVASVAGAAVSVGATAVSVGASAAGLAADAAIGTARLTGKAVGAAVDAAGGDDHSGVSVRFREPTAADREKRRLAEQQAEEEDRRAAQQQQQRPAPP